MSVRELKTIMDYVDSKIRKLQDEIEYLKILKDFLEYRIKKLSIEPSNVSFQQYYRRQIGEDIQAVKVSGASPTSYLETS